LQISNAKRLDIALALRADRRKEQLRREARSRFGGPWGWVIVVAGFIGFVFSFYLCQKLSSPTPRMILSTIFSLFLLFMFTIWTLIRRLDALSSLVEGLHASERRDRAEPTGDGAGQSEGSAEIT
jgi:hypothetical protein